MTVANRTQRAKPDSDLLKLADKLPANYKKPAVRIPVIVTTYSGRS